MEIKNTYLMWIGSEHYKTIEDWVKEATEQGVSKRLPNSHMGKSLMEPGTVVFVAHDEGDMDECGHCSGAIECPDCRKAQALYDRETALAAKLTEEANAKVNHGMGLVHVLDAKERKSALKRAENASERAKKADEAMESCERCLGSNEVEAGTGGTVVFEDGNAWDYRRYMYHRNQPAKWTAEDQGGIATMKRCEACGGSGRIPNGKVFGCFVPEAIEYIESADSKKLDVAKEAGFDIVAASVVGSERKRGCGKRRPGGTYAVTKVSSKSTAGAEAVEALGLEGCEVKGNFVSLGEAVDISGSKRFRGLAKWEMPSDVEDEAEMIAEAMDD